MEEQNPVINRKYCVIWNVIKSINRQVSLKKIHKKHVMCILCKLIKVIKYTHKSTCQNKSLVLLEKIMTEIY